MDTEIEIKLFVASDEDALPAIIERAATVTERSAKKLGNVYFDTPDKTLRELDMGLRVRSVSTPGAESQEENSNVQTIKTSGRVMGGLHQRPEYNVDIDQSRPDLSLFPRKIWPTGCDLGAIQSALVPLFSTHFQRQIWQLRFEDGSEVEVAYDVGEIAANQQTQAIHELEFELLKGRPEHLFTLAREVSRQCPVRLGHLSKAARGYTLASGNPLHTAKPIGAVPVTAQASVEQGLEATLSLALSHIQDHEQIYIDSGSLEALAELVKGVRLFSEALRLYQPAITSDSVQLFEEELTWLLEQFAWLDDAQACKAMLANKGYYLRKVEDRRVLEKSLARSRLAMPSRETVKQLFHSARYTHFILAVTEWVFEQGWRRYRIGDQTALTAPLSSLARSNLSQAWAQVRQIYFGSGDAPSTSTPFGDEQAYLKALEPLKCALYSGVCFRHVFDQQAVTGYRTPWLDIYRGTQELKQLDYLLQLAEGETLLDQTQFQRWYARKRDSLCHAIEQSRLMAAKMQPYW